MTEKTRNNPEKMRPGKNGGMLKSGNQKSPGRPKSQPFKEALLKALNNPKALTDVITALVAQGKSGNVPAIKEIADRLDGKTTESIEISGGVQIDNIAAKFFDDIRKRRSS